MYFASIVEVHVEGDTATVRANPTGIAVANAISFTVLVTAATGYRGFQLKPDTPLEEITINAKRQLEAAATKSFATLYTRHLEDHQRLFRRVSINLAHPTLRNPQTNALRSSLPRPIHLFSHSTFNTAAIFSSAVHVPVRNPQICKASGTIRSRLHGAPTGPPISTSR
jgi:hypothetical protein